MNVESKPCPHCHYAGCSPNCPAPLWLTNGKKLAEGFGLPYVMGEALAQQVAGALAAAEQRGAEKAQAERTDGGAS